MSRASRISTLTLAAIAVTLSSGCVALNAPRGWLPNAEQAQREAFGAWATLTTTAQAADTVAQERTSRSPRTPARSGIEGELIAVSPDSLFVLRENRLEVVAVRDVTHLRLDTFDPETGEITTWFVLGTLATVSHGLLLILSAPVWLISGSVAASSVSRRPLIRRDADELRTADIARYARFPQGLPPNLDRAALRPR